MGGGSPPACARLTLAAGFIAASLALAGLPADAACRISDFMDQPLSALAPVQRLAFIAQMTPSEYDHLKASGADPLLVASGRLAEARQTAQARLDGLKLEDSAGYQKVWASDFLSEAALGRYILCSSQQRPGLWITGRPSAPGVFTAVFAHYLPVGVEKITLRVVAADNIANIEDFKAALAALGAKDFFTVQSFPLKLADPTKRAVLILRSGWEHPTWLYIPAYPAPDLR
jgi:hypothetical protein